MREITCISNDWLFCLEDKPGKGFEDLKKDSYEKIHLPHTNKMLPYNYFDEKCFQKKSLYLKELIIEKNRGKRIFIDFEGVMAHAKVKLNGVLLGENKGGYTGFSFEITKQLKENNLLSVEVDSQELPGIPPFGGRIDYLTYGGIYRDVHLRYQNDCFINNVQILCEAPLKSSKALSCNIFFNPEFPDGEVELETQILHRGDICYKETASVYIKKSQTTLCLEGLDGFELWSPSEPNLYDFCFVVKGAEKKDGYYCSYGFRQAEFTPKGFFLNGEPFKILGLNRHQSFPYFGYAAPKNLQIKDAHILKEELGINLVRTSHYPQSRHFLDSCDRIGLLVFEEIPGWQHIGDQAWQDLAVEEVRKMITRDWNRPSIILWGVRINESEDNDAFYTRTNAMAHELDPLRQTGGVRYTDKSSFLEDVYTMNDFNHNGVNAPLRPQQEVTGLDKDVPYLICEFNGHMYPTKRFDQEERQMEHTLRHFRVQNHSFGTENISGAIGWCAFDYNTHKDFGSGDRICYHGVMDMFRIPKLAAYAYSSQCSPEEQIILKPITFWTLGDRSIGGILPLVVATNCDEVTLCYGDNSSFIKTLKPNTKDFPFLPHPPMVITEEDFEPGEISLWGMQWESVLFQGFIKGKKVAEHRFVSNPLPTRLVVKPDTQELEGAFKDAVRIVVRVEDQVGNLLPFLDDQIYVEVTGPGRIMGPAHFVLKGGASAFWVEHCAPQGEITIKVHSSALEQKEQFCIQIR